MQRNTSPSDPPRIERKPRRRFPAGLLAALTAAGSLAALALPWARAADTETAPGPLRIHREGNTLFLSLPEGPPSPHLVETSTDLTNWSPWLYGMTPGSTAQLPAPQGGSAWFRARLADPAADDCGTWEQARPRMLALMDGMEAGDEVFGEPDLPAVRNSFIPTEETPVKTIRLRFHLIAEAGGANPASSLARTDEMVQALNRQFGPWRLQFTHTARVVSAPQFRVLHYSGSYAMKAGLSESPDTQLNIFVTRLVGAAGVGTFPWDGDALTASGGIVIGDEASGVFTTERTTLAHEVGHCIGLWHTHHGVSEVEECGPSYETPGGARRDVTGDLCADTPATPTLGGCVQPVGVDPCSRAPWGLVDIHNFMSYSSCRERFTPQQAGRMHAWIAHRLTGWLVGQAVPELPAPDRFTATPTLTGVQLMWRDPLADNTGFRIESSTDRVTYLPVATPAGNVVSLTGFAVPAGVTTWFRIRTERNAESSAWTYSAPVVRPGAAPPAAPSHLALTPPRPPGAPVVAVEWRDNSTDETGFQIERAMDGGGFSLLASPPAGASGVALYADTAVTLNHIYSYRVRAVKGTLFSDWCPVVSVDTLAAVFPAPSALALAVTSAGSIRVRWDDNTTTETGFEVQRAGVDLNWSTLTTAPAGTDGQSRIVDTAVSPGTVYFYRVRAVNASLNSAWSAALSIGVPPAPAAPSSLALSVTSAGGIRVQWNDNSANETGFEVERSLNGGAFLQLAFAPENANATARVADTGAVPGAAHTYRVRALRGILASAFSATASLTLADAPLAAPTLATPNNASTAARRAPHFQWSTVGGAASYQVEVQNTATGNTVRSYPNGTTVPAVTAPEVRTPESEHLRTGVAYRWRARALNGSGQPGSWSGWFTFTPRVETPLTPVPLTPANGATGVSSTPRLDWDADDDSTHHDLQVRIDSPTGAMVLERIDRPGDSAYTLTEAEALNSLKSYHWRVRDSNGAGESPWSAWFSFTTRELAPNLAPTLTAPANGAVDRSERPEFTWSPLSRATSYDLRITQVNNGTTKMYPGLTATTFRANVGDELANNRDFDWQVRGKNSLDGPWSAPWRFRTRPVVTTLTAPAHGATGVSRTVTLQWDDVAGAASYLVQAGTDPAFAAGTLRVDTTAAASQHAVPDVEGQRLQRLTTYHWRVRPVMADGGNAPWSDVWSFTTRNEAPTEAPNLVSPANGAVDRALRPTFEWTPLAAATTYTLEVRRVNDPTIFKIYTGITTTSFRIPEGEDLAADRLHDWKVLGKNAVAADGPWSAPWRFRTRP